MNRRQNNSVNKPNKGKKKNSNPNPAKRRTRRKRQRTTRSANKSRVAAIKFGLAHCSNTYLRVLTNPFDSSIQDACVPDLYDLPTAKYRYVQRGTMVIGTAGVGFISMNPFGACVNDVGNVNFTISTFAGTTVATTATTGVNTGVSSQAPFATANIGTAFDDAQVRIVGCGLRARYIGTELSRSGRMIIYRAKRNFGDVFGMSAIDLLNERTTITVPVTKGWHSVAFQPSNSTDYSYLTSTASLTANTSASYCIFVDGATAATSFEWEIVSFFEYSGPTANTSPSHSDLPGMSAVKNCLNKEVELQEPSEGVFLRSLRWIQDNASIETSGAVLTNAMKLKTLVA